MVSYTEHDHQQKGVYAYIDACLTLKMGKHGREGHTAT